jgi:small subunit ribosomal protein S16
MKRMGRKHRSFFRICATDSRAPRDGRVIEELGTYDPLVADTDARAIINGDRMTYWLSVGAKPSDRVRVLIKKYGPAGTHLKQHQAALEKLKAPKAIPDPGAPKFVMQPKKAPEAAPAATEPAAATAEKAPAAAEAPAPAAPEAKAPEAAS